jgi:hypothetical protein
MYLQLQGISAQNIDLYFEKPKNINYDVNSASFGCHTIAVAAA